MHRKEIRRVARRSLRYRRRSRWTDRIEEERVRLVPTLSVPAAVLECVHIKSVSPGNFLHFLPSISLSLFLSPNREDLITLSLINLSKEECKEIEKQLIKANVYFGE